MFKAEETLRDVLYSLTADERYVTSDLSEERAAEAIRTHGVRDVAALDDSLLLELGNSTALLVAPYAIYDETPGLEYTLVTRVAESVS